MSLEITGAGKSNQSKRTEDVKNNHRSDDRKERRTRRDEDRKERSDAQYKSLTDVLRPALGGKNLSPRADLIHKWLKLSLIENKEILPEYDIRIGTISREQGYEVRYPGLILTVNHKGSNRVAAHVLLVSDGEVITPKKRRVYGNEDITPIIVPSKTWNDNYERQVKAEIQAMYAETSAKLGDLKFASMGCTIIPATMPIHAYGENPTNDNNPLDSLFVQVVESLTSFDRFLRRDESKVKLGKIFDSRHQVMSANVDQIPSIEFDVLGQPRRSDFCISLGVKKRTDRDEEDHDKDKDFDYNKIDNEDSGTILRVTGFVVPYYTIPDFKQNRPQNFGLNIVITDISGDSTPSPELFLYGLASVSVLTANDLWVDGFKPSILTATPNRNPGGLFLEIPDKNDEAMRRKEYASSAQEELLRDIDFLFNNDVKISLDCNDSGSLNWISDMFALNQSDNLFEAANNLTDDVFDEISAGDYDAIARNQTRRFYLGQAETEQGLRDIREVDYLYLINAFDENNSSKAAAEWDYSIGDDNELGLWQRLTAIEDVYGHGSFQVTGFTDRVVVEPDFVKDLVDSLDELDMLPKFDNYSKNSRPKQRLSAENVVGKISSRTLGSVFRGRTSGRSGRTGSNYRDRD